MECETLYNFGDYVWAMNKDKAVQGWITSIKVCNFKSVMRDVEYRITYDVHFCNGSEDFGVNQDTLFPTKEELIESL